MAMPHEDPVTDARLEISLPFIGAGVALLAMLSFLVF